MELESSARLTGARFGEAHRALAEAIDGYLHGLGDKRDRYFREATEQHHFPDELFDAMAKLGVFGALIPEEYGGSGLGLLGMVIALERFSAVGLTNTMALLMTMDAMVVQRGGTEAQRAQWLPSIADGAMRLAFAITEPDSGTNSFRMKLRATPQADGTFRLNGEKAWITGVDRASHVLVVARTTTYEETRARSLPSSFGLSLFLVPTDSPGLSRSEMSTVGVEGFRQFHLRFDDVVLDPDLLIGDVDRGAELLFVALNPERISAAAIAVGMVDYFVTRAARYAKERIVFGERPIGAYQAVAHPLARIRASQEAARLLVYEAASAFDEGAPSSQVGTLANMAKYLSSELAFEAADRAIQTHGGNGFVTDFGLIQLLAAARLQKTAPINNEMILNFVAEHELGLPRSY